MKSTGHASQTDVGNRLSEWDCKTPSHIATRVV